MGSKLFCAFLIAGRAMAQAPASDAPKYPPGLYALITTSVGVITAQLFEKETPVTVRVFIGLARGTQQWLDPKTRKPATHPLYENLIFHRVIPDFMIQTGDPTATGAHDCGFRLPDEFVDALKFDRPGRLAMANAGPGTAACQFFYHRGQICGRQRTLRDLRPSGEWPTAGWQDFARPSRRP